MSGKSAAGFFLGATMVALVGATALFAYSAGDGVLNAIWAVMGFLAMALPGVAGGVWRAREHGCPGSGFVLALQAGILLRLVLASVVAIGAARAGEAVMKALVAGLVAGFVPVMVFEMAWFGRSRGSQDARTETRG